MLTRPRYQSVGCRDLMMTYLIGFFFSRLHRIKTHTRPSWDTAEP